MNIYEPVKAWCLTFRGKIQANTVGGTKEGVHKELWRLNSMGMHMSSPGRKGDNYSPLKEPVWIVPDSEYQKLVKGVVQL